MRRDTPRSACPTPGGAPGGHADFTRCARAFEAEFNYLHRTVLRHGVSPQEAEDAVQSVFLTMCRRWDEYDQSRPLRPWLAGIAARSAHGRRQRREVPVGVPLASDEALDPEQQLFANRARALVMAALATLPEKHRAVLVMRELDDLSVSDIAQIQKVSLQTASARVRSARKAFARAVRRLTNTGVLGRMAFVPSVEALLAAERPVPPAPADLRERAVARAHRQRQLPDFPRPGVGPTAAAAGIFVGAVAMIAGVIAGVHGRPAAVRTAVTAAHGAAPASAAQRPAALPVPPAPAPAPAALRAGPPDALAYYPFEGNPRDLSGGGNDCRLHGLEAPWIAGARGRGIALGGRGWLECPRIERLADMDDEITVAAWIRPRSRWGAQTIVARQKGNGRADDVFFGLVNDRLLVRSRTFRKQLDRVLPNRDGWIHVAFTRRIDGTLTLYAGGSPIGQNRGRPMSIGGGQSALTIGGSLHGPDPTAADELFGGDIDEVLIFRRALSSEELAALAVR